MNLNEKDTVTQYCVHTENPLTSWWQKSEKQSDSNLEILTSLRTTTENISKRLAALEVRMGKVESRRDASRDDLLRFEHCLNDNDRRLASLLQSFILLNDRFEQQGRHRTNLPENSLKDAPPENSLKDQPQPNTHVSSRPPQQVERDHWGNGDMYKNDI
jgi:hypothetical protein